MKKALIPLISALFLFQCSKVDREMRLPNIILILTDDQGWNDVGFNGSKDILTPNLDALAAEGVIFTQGYVSHPYCSPSRAGLLTGKYQQHFGHESNPGYIEFTDSIPDGLPIDEILLSQILKENGYSTAAIGKWHLGDAPQYWPTERGYDYWYGFSGGGRSYWPQQDPAPHHILHNSDEDPDEDFHYLTDKFSEKAVEYIQKQKKKPFFIYLAYNAPHAPIQATNEYLAESDYLEDGQRSSYAAMITGIDEGVKKIRNVLEKEDIYNNTMIIYLSDNGGHDLGASNYPLRGHKGMLFEGGIRVPFLISWPAGMKGGEQIADPVISLDLFPTILDAAGIDPSDDLNLDGVSLLPFINGNQSSKPHEILFWRYSNGMGYAVRQGKYKLVSQHMKSLSLFDMEEDPFEQHNLVDALPDITGKLNDLYLDWNKKNIEALWKDPHIENVEKQERARQFTRNKASAGESK